MYKQTETINIIIIKYYILNIIICDIFYIICSGIGLCFYDP